MNLSKFNFSLKMSPRIICIDGNIGAGKSTVLSNLREMGFSVHQEEVPDWSWVLEKYYADPTRWALTLQIAILNSSVKIYNEISKMKDDVVFIERSLPSHLVFAKNSLHCGNMSIEEFRVIQDLYNQFSLDSSIIIFIQTDVNVCLKRIAQRNRPGEQSITSEYLKSIEQEYNDTNDSKIIIDGNVSEKEILTEILKRV